LLILLVGTSPENVKSWDYFSRKWETFAGGAYSAWPLSARTDHTWYHYISIFFRVSPHDIGLLLELGKYPVPLQEEE
jgi:hypothetical protein